MKYLAQLHNVAGFCLKIIACNRCMSNNGVIFLGTDKMIEIDTRLIFLILIQIFLTLPGQDT